MTDAPERLWAFSTGIQPQDGSAGLWCSNPAVMDRGTEYVRADLVEAAVRRALEAAATAAIGAAFDGSAVIVPDPWRSIIRAIAADPEAVRRIVEGEG